MKHLFYTLLITLVCFNNSINGMKRANTASKPCDHNQQIQPFSWLPEELIDRIAGHCEPATKDLMNRVCQAWSVRLGDKETILLANPATVTLSHKLKKIFEYTNSGNAQKLALWLSALSAQDINSVIDLVDYAESSNDFSTDRTPLEIAIDNNDIHCAQVLIQYGADVNSGEKDGYASPLMLASLHGHTQIAQLLVDHGAHIHYASSNNDEETPLIAALKNGHIDTVELLIKRGADVNQADTNGLIPLHDASEYGRIEIIELLIKHNAKINQTDNRGVTPLISALYSCCTADVVQLLLDHGAYIDQVTVFGLTPLIVASLQGQTKAVQLLLKRGANIYQSITDHSCLINKYPTINTGDTALEIAQKLGHTEIVRLIQEHITKKQEQIQRIKNLRKIGRFGL